eukprot:4981318-Amphidinium_carterae.1
MPPARKVNLLAMRQTSPTCELSTTVREHGSPSRICTRPDSTAMRTWIGWRRAMLPCELPRSPTTDSKALKAWSSIDANPFANVSPGDHTAVASHHGGAGHTWDERVRAGARTKLCSRNGHG